MGRRKRPLHERFWEKVDRRGPDECWPWKAYRHPKGYGEIFVAGKIRSAHHVALELDGRLTGRPSYARHVRHSCDNPPCCNPAHLTFGTAQKNMQEREERGRRAAPRGEKQAMAKLTDIQASAIRAALAAGETQASQARRYSVSGGTIWKLAHGKTWKHV